MPLRNPGWFVLRTGEQTLISMMSVPRSVR